MRRQTRTHCSRGHSRSRADGAGRSRHCRQASPGTRRTVSPAMHVAIGAPGRAGNPRSRTAARRCPRPIREMRAMAQTRTAERLHEKLEREHNIASRCCPRMRWTNATWILEIRAGTGGDEAALFAGDLFRMYERYAACRAGRSRSDRPAKAPWAATRKSSPSQGARRVRQAEVRIRRASCPARADTETSGASTPRRRPSPCCRKPRRSTSRSRGRSADRHDARAGRGGQHVNKTESAIRITHISDRHRRDVQDERSQHKNRARAMAILRSPHLYDAERQRLDAVRSADQRKGGRSAPATAPSASAPTISRKAASPITAST
jgi:peptide chain release factor 1